MTCRLFIAANSVTGFRTFLKKNKSIFFALKTKKFFYFIGLPEIFYANS
ncbi:hypothetical Protein YC6258_01258 [Gynuella sunshinyii YC6258]|uniref:Uncharacterized protein n=1 Tax=Gynuella sunshinyii YC6258 TaxID=1445510 RepID=A0A0C5VFI7_9GAMM|nr:hypothetical Protein YC6258_01258 [Gynuella sunshinyii YC6258]